MGKAHDRINKRMCEITSMRELKEEFALLTDFAKAFQHSNMLMSLKHDCVACHSKLSQIETIEQNFEVSQLNLDLHSMRKCVVDMVRQTKGEACITSEIIDLFLLYADSFVNVDTDTAEEIMDAVFFAARGNAEYAHEVALKLNETGVI